MQRGKMKRGIVSPQSDVERPGCRGGSPRTKRRVNQHMNTPSFEIQSSVSGR
jgi:hypothetical protein